MIHFRTRALSLTFDDARSRGKPFVAAFRSIKSSE